MNFIDHPFHFDNAGKTAATNADDHIRDMIYQVLFTNPGERVNRPDFGCGLRQMVFMPNNDALAAATQFLAQSALQRWLANEIKVESVLVDNNDSRLTVTVTYVRRDNRQRERAHFASPFPQK